jgi:hypothetical protein
MIKSKCMRLAEHVARIRTKDFKANTIFQQKNSKEIDCLEDLGVYGRIVIKLILKN